MKSQAYIMQVILLYISSSIIDVKSQTACGEQQTQIACQQPQFQDTCIWETVSEKCKCKSEIKQDIFFGIDVSSSIGWTDFQKEKIFLTELASQGVGGSTKMGFDIFSTGTNISRNLQFWPNNNDLILYVNGIRWMGGLTSTRQYLRDTINQFNSYGSKDRSRIAMLITDGVPCEPGPCPANVCHFAPELDAANIRVIVVGVGDGWVRKYHGISGSKRLECITAPGDIYEVGWDQFDQLLSNLSAVVCPISKTFIITEIKPMDDRSSKTNRFIEIYNVGVGFNTNDITFEGNLIVGNPITNVSIVSGQYVIFYDGQTDYNDVKNVTCQQCLAPPTGACDLSSCSGPSSSAVCWCSNSVYIPCGRNSSDAERFGCYFNNNNDESSKRGWNIVIHSGVGISGLVIDSVTWTNDWIIVENGYSLELRSKTADNDLSSSWKQACDVRGTPGTDPLLDCLPSCDSTSCNVNGGSNICNTNINKCECQNGYYPSGRLCLRIPEMNGTCNVIWVKNNSTNIQTAYYQWTAVKTSLPVRYTLNFYDAQNGNQLTGVITYQTYYDTTTHSLTANKTYPAYVTACIRVNITDYCDTKKRVLCKLISTSVPTPSPTKFPSIQPITVPTLQPTMRPTFECPLIWLTHLCGAVDRCACKASPIHLITDTECCMESKPKAECNAYDGDKSKPIEISADGEIKSVTVKVYKNFPFITYVNWTLELIKVIPGKSVSKNNTTNNFTLKDVGIEIEPMFGMVEINGTKSKSTTDLSPKDTADIHFSVTPLNCTCDPGQQKKDCDINKCFDGWSATFILRLEKHHPSSLQDECWTSNMNNPYCCTIVYPFNVTYDISRNTKKIVASTNENELPPWLWWLIAALFAILCILLCFVYKFWWKAKAVAKVLAITQEDLDAAVAEEEMGFAADIDPDNVNFNPIAIGQPNMHANAGDVLNPNMNNGVGNERPNVMDEKFQYRMAYGQQIGQPK